ncbi:MAG: hypothetical protein JRN02_00885 [Nitrososphaerota archaeon]|nr:hypothetical protein [Nitrososphaerota archaeon]
MIQALLMVENFRPPHLENLVITGLKLRYIVSAAIVLAGLYTFFDQEIVHVM